MIWLDHVAVKRLPQDTRKNPGFRSGPWSRHPVVRSRSLWTPSFRWRGSGSSDPIRVTTKPHTLRIRTLRVQTLVIEGSIPSKEGPRILRVEGRVRGDTLRIHPWWHPLKTPSVAGKRGPSVTPTHGDRYERCPNVKVQIPDTNGTGICCIH